MSRSSISDGWAEDDDAADHAGGDERPVDSFVIFQGLPQADVVFLGAWVCVWDEEPAGLDDALVVVFDAV